MVTITIIITIIIIIIIIIITIIIIIVIIIFIIIIIINSNILLEEQENISTESYKKIASNLPKWLSIWHNNFGTFSFISSSSFFTGAMFQIVTFPESSPGQCEKMYLIIKHKQGHH